MHHFAGRAAIALGIANVYIGLNIQEESVTYYIAYSAVLGALVLVWFGKELLDILHPRFKPLATSPSTELAQLDAIRSHDAKVRNTFIPCSCERKRPQALQCCDIAVILSTKQDGQAELRCQIGWLAG